MFDEAEAVLLWSNSQRIIEPDEGKHFEEGFRADIIVEGNGLRLPRRPPVW